MPFVPIGLAVAVKLLALLREFARVLTLAHAVRQRARPSPHTGDPKPPVRRRVHAEDGEFPLRLGLKARRQSVRKIPGMQA
jgi:hypothetical protein